MIVPSTWNGNGLVAVWVADAVSTALAVGRVADTLPLVTFTLMNVDDWIIPLVKVGYLTLWFIDAVVAVA